MKLVILHHDSDGCTWQCTNTHPIEYESAEKLTCDMKKFARNSNGYTSWNNTGIFPSAILGTDEYSSIEILTLEEWYESCGVRK